MSPADEAQVFVGIGSNIEPRRNIPHGLSLLAERFGELQISQTYECPAVGFEGEPFCNLVVGLETGMAPQAVVEALHAVEYECGRNRQEKMRSRTLDLDLLLYDDLVSDDPALRLPRRDILCYAFVLKPLSELVPDARHPVNGRRYADLWAAFEATDQPLTPVDIT